MEGRVIAVIERVDVAAHVDEPVRHVCVKGVVGKYFLHRKLLFTIIIDVAAHVDEPVRHVCAHLEAGEADVIIYFSPPLFTCVPLEAGEAQ